MNKYFLMLFISACSTILGIFLSKREKYSFSNKDYVAIFLLSALWFGLFSIKVYTGLPVGLTYVLRLSVACMLSSSFIVDCKVKELPDGVSFVATILAIAALITNLYEGWILTVIATIVLTIVFFFVSILTGGFGMGDVKLMIPVSLLVSHYMLMGFAYNTLIPAVIFAIALFAVKRKEGQTITEETLIDNLSEKEADALSKEFSEENNDEENNDEENNDEENTNTLEAFEEADTQKESSLKTKFAFGPFIIIGYVLTMTLFPLGIIFGGV